MTKKVMRSYTEAERQKHRDDFRKFGGFDGDINIQEYADSVGISQATLRGWFFPEKKLAYALNKKKKKMKEKKRRAKDEVSYQPETPNRDLIREMEERLDAKLANLLNSNPKPQRFLPSLASILPPSYKMIGDGLVAGRKVFFVEQVL